jgi:hypothetical protein
VVAARHEEQREPHGTDDGGACEHEPPAPLRHQAHVEQERERTADGEDGEQERPGDGVPVPELVHRVRAEEREVRERRERAGSGGGERAPREQHVVVARATVRVPGGGDREPEPGDEGDEQDRREQRRAVADLGLRVRPGGEEPEHRARQRLQHHRGHHRGGARHEVPVARGPMAQGVQHRRRG